MSDAWYLHTIELVDRAGMSLWMAKANAAGDEDYQKQLKYQLKGFLHCAGILREAKPDAEESQAEYIERLAILSATPGSVAAVDRADWEAGRRKFLRAIASAAA